MIIWGIVRSLDERLLLGQESHSGSLGVQIEGVVLAPAGAALLARQLTVARSTPGRSVDPHAPATPEERRSARLGRHRRNTRDPSPDGATPARPCASARDSN